MLFICKHFMYRLTSQFLCDILRKRCSMGLIIYQNALTISQMIFSKLSIFAAAIHSIWYVSVKRSSGSHCLTGFPLSLLSFPILFHAFYCRAVVPEAYRVKYIKREVVRPEWKNGDKHLDLAKMQCKKIQEHFWHWRIYPKAGPVEIIE